MIRGKIRTEPNPPRVIAHTKLKGESERRTYKKVVRPKEPVIQPNDSDE